jgi:hypothetical protein
MVEQEPEMWENFLPECVAGMNFTKQRTTIPGHAWHLTEAANQDQAGAGRLP